MQIRNGRVFYKNQFFDKEAIIENGLIKRIGNVSKTEEERQDEVIDAKGMLVLPGLVDMHVHLREPGDIYKEDFETGSGAAIAGGITTVFDMPNNRFPTITAQRLKEKQELARKKAVCDVFFHFGATEDNFEDIKKADPISLKMYLSETTGTENKLEIRNKEIIKRHFEEFDGKILIHAQGEKLIKETAELVKSNKMHLTHATSKDELGLIKKFNGTTDVTPHHLFLSKKYEEKLGKLANVKPPLQSETERKDLWKNLDKIDCIATDHAPHTLEDKENGAYGFPGLETSFSLMLKGYYQRLISLEDIIGKMSYNPAKIFNLKDRGEIAVGRKADLILVDMKREWVVKGEEFETKCKWSPFEGWKLKGKVIKVIRNGRLVYDGGSFLK